MPYTFRLALFLGEPAMKHLPKLLIFSILAISCTVGLIFAQNATEEKPEKSTQVSAADQVASQLADDYLPPLPAKLLDAIQNKETDLVVKLADELAGKLTKDKDADFLGYVLYLKGRALYNAKKYDDAIDAFTKAVATDSSWSRRSRFAQGAAYARKGNFEQAEKCYKTEAVWLLSDAKRQEIANIYLEFADSYFKPPKKGPVETPPNYGKALEFYQKAIESHPEMKKRPEIELIMADCFRLSGNTSEAIKRYEKYVTENKKSEKATPEQLIHANFYLGEMWLKSGNAIRARRVWRDLIREYASDDKDTKLVTDASFQLAKTYGFPRPSSSADLDLGIAAMKKFAATYPKDERVADAFFQIAQAQQSRGRQEDAAVTLVDFLANKEFAKNKQIPTARVMLGQIYLAQQKFDDAIKIWKEYLSLHPTDKQWSSVQRQIINTEYAQASYYLQKKKYAEARVAFQKFLAKYPIDPRATEIMFNFGQMQILQKKYKEAIADWEQLIAKYPTSSRASQAQFLIAKLWETEFKDLDKAIEKYKEVKGNYNSQARLQLTRLTAKTFRIATQRTFRSDETAQVQFTSRNLEQVKVEVYRIDLETYFRKVHSTAGTGGLDISLIDPDKTFEYEVPKFQKYLETENNIAIPIPTTGSEKEAPKQGAMLVTVSSDKLEATTLVIQSDLDFVLKTSRDELLIYAQNMRTGKPWPGAKILLSNGREVFTTETTGDDGVFQKKLKELATGKDVRAFLVADGNIASDICPLAGTTSQGLAARCYLYTDRPAYQAGQLVHVRAVVRHVDGNSYTVSEGKEYDGKVFDARGRLVWEFTKKLSAFGTLHEYFTLPEGAPVGNYRVVLTDKKEGKETFTGNFQVHVYKLQPVYLDIETDRNVFFRGEEIKGTIKAAYYHGAPVANKEIRYTLANDKTNTATTNDAGEVEFTLSTQDFREQQTLNFRIELPDYNLQLNKSFYLAKFGYSLNVSLPQSLYLVGEMFEVTASASDAEGEKVAREITLEVLKRTVEDGTVVEKSIEKFPLKTGDKYTPNAGVAKKSLSLDEDGTYILRVTGTDRFENPVTSETRVTISGDNDATRLRLLTKRQTYKSGEAAKINVHWREDPAKALLVCKGATIIRYLLLDLKKGDNPLALPLDEEYTPHFLVDADVMVDARLKEKITNDDAKKRFRSFHSAALQLTVTQELNVTMEVKPTQGDEAIPGEDVTVTLRTTDPVGKPVSAELSLAMVEQALLSRFPQTVSPINQFFQLTRRQTTMRTDSSITFKYSPATQQINSRLLAEKARIENEAAQGRRLSELKAEEEAKKKTAERAYPRAVVAPALPVPGGADPFGGPAPPAASIAPTAPADPFGAPDSEAVISGTGQMGGMGGGGSFNAPAREQRQQAGNQPQAWSDGLAQVDDDQALNEPLPGPDLNGRGVRYDGAKTGKPSNRVSGNSLRQARQAEGIYVPHVEQSKIVLDLFNHNREVQVVDAQGNYGYLNGLKFSGRDPQQANASLEKLRASGALLLTKMVSQETGYWNPALVTDAKGETSITFTLPIRSTEWNFQARGITKNTLAGQTTEKLKVRKPLFARLRTPTAFTDGDTATLRADIFADATIKGDVKLVLTTKLGEKSQRTEKVVSFKKNRAAEVMFDVELNLPETAAELGHNDLAANFTLTAKEVDAKKPESDSSSYRVPVLPYGLAISSTAGGTATSDATAIISPVTGAASGSRNLEILIGPTPQRSLLEAILGGPTIRPLCQLNIYQSSSVLDVATSDLLASLALKKEFLKTLRPLDVTLLESRIRSTVLQLVSCQNTDGTWSWTGIAGRSANPFATARAYWALSEAKEAGYEIASPPMDKAKAQLAQMLAKTGVSDYETKAVLLHALTTGGTDDFTTANQVHRQKDSLSSKALLYLALAFAEMDRKEPALELESILVKKNFDTDAAVAKAANTTATQLHALHALLLGKIAPTSATFKKEADYLLAHRLGGRFSPEKATGPAFMALAKWFAVANTTAGEATKYTLVVSVNGKSVKKLAIDAANGSQKITVPAKFLTDGEQKVRFELTGRGQYTYQCLLQGFVPVEKLQGKIVGLSSAYVRRRYFQLPPEVDGRRLSPSYGIVAGSYSTLYNYLTQLSVAKRGRVSVECRGGYSHSSRTPLSQRTNLVVTESIPAGVSLVEGKISGSFERYEILPGAIRFYFPNSYYANFSYEVSGYIPGKFRALPTLVQNANKPGQYAVGTTGKLDVLPLGVASKDTYQYSPGEYFFLAKYYLGKENYDQTILHLETLQKKWRLDPAPYKEMVEMLFRAYLAKNNDAKIVHYFEILFERYPEIEISFEKLLRVSEAYHKIGEYERAYMVIRGIVEGRFLQESQVAGFLTQQGEFLRSTTVMDAILRNYPPEAYVAAAEYALAQSVFGKAATVAKDAKLREAKITRVDLVHAATTRLNHFLTRWPEDPAADQASYSLATALLELEFFKRTIGECEKFIKRYPESDLIEDFRYILGYCNYSLGNDAEALKICREVAEKKHLDKKTGRMVESANKWQATYILGQIYNSLGKLSEAITEYEKVKDRYTDARDAIASFERTALTLPEISHFKPQKKAKEDEKTKAVKIELEYRNIKTCDILVYKIDLMKFSLLRRNLANVTSINLSGIRPYHTQTVELGDGKDYRDCKKELELPLTDLGAYLVVTRGDNLYATGLALVTPLELGIWEDPKAGRVRVTVTNTLTDKYVPGVDVRVIGSRNSDFKSDETDLRGLFIAEGISGTATVIARQGENEYAIYRGKTSLGGGPVTSKAPAQVSPDPYAAEASGQKAVMQQELLRNINSDNYKFQIEQQKANDSLYYNKNRGKQSLEVLRKK